MFYSRTLTTLATAVVLAVWGSVAAAATTTSCPGTAAAGRDFTLTTNDPVSNSCYAWGDVNDANDAAFQASILADFGPGYGLIDKIETPDTGGSGILDGLVGLIGGTGGAFSIDLTGLADVIIVFKVGNGGETPGFAAFLLTDFIDSVTGGWSVTLSQSLSHISLYANVAPIPLPAAGFLLIGALGGLGLMRRRRKIS